MYITFILLIDPAVLDRKPQTKERNRICYHDHKKKYISASLSVDDIEYHLPEKFVLNAIMNEVSIKTAAITSKLNNKYIFVRQPGRCDKSFVLNTFSTDDSYRAYQFQLFFGNMTDVWHEFRVDTYMNATAMELGVESLFEKLFFNIKIVPVSSTESMTFTRKRDYKNYESEFDTISMVEFSQNGICFMLQNKKSVWRLRLGEVASHEKRLLMNISKLHLIYIESMDHPVKRTVVRFQAWKCTCNNNFLTRMDLVVKKRVEGSQFHFLFCNDVGKILWTAKYILLADETILSRISKPTLRDVTINVLTLAQAKMFPLSLYIYVGKEDNKVLQCEEYPYDINFDISRVFRVTKAIFHYFPFNVKNNEGVLIWRPLHEDGIIRRIVFGDSECDWRKKGPKYL